MVSLVLVVISIGNSTKEACVWDSDDLTIETLPLADVLWYHNNVEQLNIFETLGGWTCIKPTFRNGIYEGENFILAITDEDWYVYSEGWYTVKRVSAYPSIIIPVLNYRCSPICWVVGVTGNNVVHNGMVTKTEPITRRKFMYELLKFSEAN